MSEEQKEEQQNKGDPKIGFGYIPTMLEVVRSNVNWERVYNNIVTPGLQSDAQEQMKDHELSRFHSVAAEVVGRLEVTGMTLEEIAEDTGLSQTYVNRTLNVLFETKRDNKIEI